jgi:hypothetical protein
MIRRASGVALATALTIAPACFLLTIDESKIGSSPSDAGSVNDAGSANDAPCPLDSGLEATTGFCAQRDGSACDDFDLSDSSVVVPPWGYELALPATGTLDLCNYRSAPQSFLSVVPSNATQYATARIRTPISGTPTKTRLAFSVSRAPFDLGTGDHIALAEFECSTGPSATGIWLHYRRPQKGAGDPALFLLANGGPESDGGEQVYSVNLPASTWTRFSIGVTWQNSGSVVSFLVNNVELFHGGTVTTQSPCPGELAANVGLSAAAGASGSANFDDVLLEIDPTN